MGEMWGQIHELLRRKAAAGLDVRVIYDDAGCLSLLPHNYAELLRAEEIGRASCRERVCKQV